jgi:predicted esterase
MPRRGSRSSRFILSRTRCTSIPGHFRWLGDYQIAKRDILACYHQVTTQYAVDPANILLGSYSGGAIMSLEIALADVLPAKGVIGLCPELRPESFTQENVERAAQRGMKGVFMEGEIMWPMPEEQAMLDLFQAVGFPYQFHVNPGIGHVFPRDFREKLDQAINFVMS